MRRRGAERKIRLVLCDIAELLVVLVWGLSFSNASSSNNASAKVGIGGMFYDDNLGSASSVTAFPYLYSLNYLTASNQSSATNLAGLNYYPDWTNGTAHIGRHQWNPFAGKLETRRLLEDNHNSMIIDGQAPLSCSAVSEEAFTHATPVMTYCDNPDLLEKTRHPFAIQAVSPFWELCRAMARVLKHIGVTHVSSISASDATGSWRMFLFNREVTNVGIQVVREEGVADLNAALIKKRLAVIRDSGSRVIALLGGVRDSLLVKTIARDMGMLGSSEYLWVGVGYWTAPSMLRWLPAEDRNVLFGSIVVRMKPLLGIDVEHFKQELEKYKNYEIFTSYKPYVKLLIGATMTGMDWNRMYTEAGYRFSLGFDQMFIDYFSTITLALGAINRTVSILDSYKIFPNCLNIKQFKETIEACSLPPEQITFQYQRSICNETYLNDPANAHLVSLNGYQTPCRMQNGVSRAIEIYRTTHVPALASLLSSPGILLLQQIYSSSYVLATGESLSFRVNGAIRGGTIQILNGRTVPTSQSTSLLEIPPYAKNYSVLPNNADPTGYMLNINSTSPFYGLTVDYQIIGEYNNLQKKLEMSEQPQFFASDPRQKVLTPPISLVTNDGSESTPLWVYLLSAAGGSLALVILLVAVLYLNQKQRMIYERPWLISEDELTFVSAQSQAGDHQSTSSNHQRYPGTRHSVLASTVEDIKGGLEESVESSGLAHYKENVVYWKQVCVMANLKDKICLKSLFSLKERSSVPGTYFVNQFIGMTTTFFSNNTWILKMVWAYEPRGSLDDMLMDTLNQGGRVQSDLFKTSLMLDIAKGLKYIHGIVDINVHGSLRATHCLVDQQWTCRLTNFGLSCLFTGRREMPDASNSCNVQEVKPNDSICGEMAALETKEKKAVKKKTLPPYKNSSSALLYFSQLRLQAYRKGAKDIQSGVMSSENDGFGDMQEYKITRSQEDDLYACGLVFYEILTARQLAVTLANEETEQSLSIETQLLDEGKCVGDILNLKEMEGGDASERLIGGLLGRDECPCILSSKQLVKELNRVYPQAAKSSLADMMVKKLKAYSEDLEEIIEERTEQLQIEKEKITELLYEMVPRVIAEEMLSGGSSSDEKDAYIRPKFYGSVSVFFNDIVGFTTLCANVPAQKIISMLNELFIMFDALTKLRNITKITTIGDAYMAASGVPVPNGAAHSKNICLFALDMCKTVEAYKNPIYSDHPIQMRAGINSGPVMAGVLGRKVLQYSIFGDTVNTASRMESSGSPGRVQISSDTATLLQTRFPGEFQLSERGMIAVKGKTDMKTFWLDGTTST
eukprot:Nk52_evm2s373 gene=Nk52_evmTU2s373